MRLAVATTNSPGAFSCIHVRKKPKIRSSAPVLSWCSRESPFSISSNQATAGDTSSIVRHAEEKSRSALPIPSEKTRTMSMR